MQKEGALLLPPLEHVHEYHCTPVWVRHACRIRTVRPWLTCGCICSPEGRAVVDRVPDGIVQQLIQLNRKEGVHAWSRGTNDLRRTDSCQKRGNHYRFLSPCRYANSVPFFFRWKLSARRVSASMKPRHHPISLQFEHTRLSVSFIAQNGDAVPESSFCFRGQLIGGNNTTSISDQWSPAKMKAHTTIDLFEFLFREFGELFVLIVIFCHNNQIWRLDLTSECTSSKSCAFSPVSAALYDWQASQPT